MTLVRTGFGMLVLALVMTGVAGTIYKVTSPDGWVAGAFGRGISAGFAAIASLIAILAFAWFSRGFALRFRNRYADLFVYTFAAAGFLYLAHFWLRGHF